MKIILHILLAMIFALPLMAQPPSFVLESIRANRGERASGHLEIPAGVDEGTQLPMTILHGAKTGPTLLLVAGVHGSEYAPIIALQRILPNLDPAKLSGTIILIHSANPPSFFKRTIYYSPVDGKNLNRSFPGKADGTLTERIAHAITTKLIPRADYVIDIHCGDGNEDLIPYLALYTHASTPDRIARVKALALRFGIEHIKVIGGRSADPNNSIYLTNAAQIAGKHVLAVECGGLARADEVSVNAIVNGLQNVLRHLQMLPGKAAAIKNPVLIDRDETVRTEAAGIFYPLVERGQLVKKDALLGYVTDLFGQKLLEARAPIAGKIMFVVKTPPVNAGEPLVSIGQLAPSNTPLLSARNANFAPRGIRPAQTNKSNSELKHALGIILQRFEIIAGKEQRFEEWMSFLRAERAAAVETLAGERMYFEAVFTDKSESTTYVFWLTFQGEGGKPVENSAHDLDKKHLEFWNECIKKGSRKIFPTEFYLTPEFIDAAIKQNQRQEKR